MDTTYEEIAWAIERCSRRDENRTPGSSDQGRPLIQLVIGEGVVEQVVAGLRRLHQDGFRPSDLVASS